MHQLIPHKYVTMFVESLPWLLPLLVYFSTRLVLLTISLWILLRIQNLNYTIPGIILCAALASVCDMLPVPIGAHALAVGVLIFTVIRMTRAHFVDVRFTVVISYAVMFLMQICIISAIPFQVSAYARNHAQSSIMRLITAGGLSDDEINGRLPKAAPSKTDQDTNDPVSTTVKKQVAIETNAQPAPVSIPALPKKVADAFSLKGIMGTAGNLTVMIGTGVRTYSLQVGETSTVDTSSGKMEVTLAEATQTSAVLKINGNTLPLELK
ncbi:MAG TPA: hypothetical protein VFB72_02580 [Verrucomicrobiae bacterium]|nr:hypothetical protein [Verrucomicrobiae bacterium]